MYRAMTKSLVEWKDRSEHYPLLIRGARQVGKSYLVEAFGKEHFQSTLTINFELQPQLKSCFTDLDPQAIIGKIQLLLGAQITVGQTLLFLDEIQECPSAIMALRYFREKMPQLHVIGAGSLLEFALQKSQLKMPVGRVLFLRLTPLSFSEFLNASGNAQLRQYLSGLQPDSSIDTAVHQKLLDLVRTYLVFGGMPAVLRTYLEKKDALQCQHIQTGLLQTYRSDFGKYSKTTQHKYLQKVFDASPRMVGQRIKFSNIDPDARSRDLKEATELLALAGIVEPVYSSSASGLSLGAQINERKFKFIFLDVGLMQNMCGLQAELAVAGDLMQVNSGAVAEQFVGQELKAYYDSYQNCDLFFWARDKKNSMAEVDYVMNVGAEIFPIEVKAGKGSTLRSLRLFMEEKRSRSGIRISQDKLSFTDRVLSIPLYMIEDLPRLVKSI